AAPGETLWIQPVGDARLGWNEKTWRGQFKVFVNARGKLTLATRVPLETYMIGVVPGEIGALSETLLQAGRAQAIAARSYSLFYRGRRAAEGFDLYGTVEDQVYGPVESERELATRCVTTTRGELALYDGAPIRANYCSTCGGITADVDEGWPTPPIPYLVSHRDRRGAQDYCAASPHYRWREEWPAADFVAGVVAQADAEGIPRPPEVGDLVDTRVLSRTNSGRVWELEVVTSRGVVKVPGYRLRWLLRRPGNVRSILRSNLIKIDVRRDPATRKALAVVVSGAGSGHGVGLCQTGALGMARDRATAEQILRHYYRGTEIRKLY
ncbi:MAG: SpoIID/LytB domain-containing protein, partial [bacterium]|nr:SpoIID/LytB domain-containing protein [Candidatus Kapabacteria bacterium]